MTLQQLEYVIALEKEKNFEKAAEKCFVTQPTLSMQLRKLENEIGFDIFNRTAKPLNLTDLGAIFYEKAKIIIDEAKNLKFIVNQDIMDVTGSFRMGIIPTLAPSLLPLLLPVFVEKFTDTRLNINELQSEDIIQKLNKGLLDFAVMATPLMENHIIEDPIFNEPFFGYFPDGHPQLKNQYIDMESLSLADLLILEEGHCFRNQTLHICSIDVEKTDKSVRYQSGSMETLKRLVENNMGYTLIPALSTAKDIRKDLIRKFTSPEPSREISIVYHRTFHRQGIIKAIKNILIEKLPKTYISGRKTAIVKWR